MSQRQDFAHILRGIAALSVVVAHYCGIFFQAHLGIAALLQVPPLPRLPEVSGPAGLIGDYAVILGEFGVGIFFIISGFVIPFSPTSESQLRFLKRRILRIYPVYIAGFGLVMTSVWLLTQFAGSRFGYSSDHILAHLGIILRGLMGHARIDGISWTLEVELAFYLIMTIGGIRLISKGAQPFLIGAVLVTAAGITGNQLMQAGYQSTVGLIGLQFWASLLLISGLAYHSLHSGKLHYRPFLGIQATVSTLLVLVCSDQRVFHWQWIFARNDRLRRQLSLAREDPIHGYSRSPRQHQLPALRGACPSGLCSDVLHDLAWCRRLWSNPGGGCCRLHPLSLAPYRNREAIDAEGSPVGAVG